MHIPAVMEESCQHKIVSMDTGRGQGPSELVRGSRYAGSFCCTQMGRKKR